MKLRDQVKDWWRCRRVRRVLAADGATWVLRHANTHAIEIQRYEAGVEKDADWSEDRPVEVSEAIKAMRAERPYPAGG